MSDLRDAVAEMFTDPVTGKPSSGWHCTNEIADRLREALAATPPEPGLDEIRLAKALVVWGGSLHAAGVVTLDDDGRIAASRIAAEYARLSPREPT